MQKGRGSPSCAILFRVAVGLACTAPAIVAASVGEGRDVAQWTALLNAVRKAGYDDVISIEHEDPRYDGPEGTQRSLTGLQRAIGQQKEAA